MKESTKTQTKTKPNDPRETRQPLKGKKVDNSLTHVGACEQDLGAGIWIKELPPVPPTPHHPEGSLAGCAYCDRCVSHNYWLLFHTGYMYIRILLDRVISTQPISVSVLVGVLILVTESVYYYYYYYHYHYCHSLFHFLFVRRSFNSQRRSR